MVLNRIQRIVKFFLERVSLLETTGRPRLVRDKIFLVVNLVELILI